MNFTSKVIIVDTIIIAIHTSVQGLPDSGIKNANFMVFVGLFYDNFTLYSNIGRF